MNHFGKNLPSFKTIFHESISGVNESVNIKILKSYSILQRQMLQIIDDQIAELTENINKTKFLIILAQRFRQFCVIKTHTKLIVSKYEVCTF